MGNLNSPISLDKDNSPISLDTDNVLGPAFGLNAT